MSTNPVEYEEYAMAHYLIKEASKLIERGKKGSGDEIGTVKILNFYADSAEDINREPLTNIKTLGSGEIMKVDMGFLVLKQEEKYYLFRRSKKNAIAKKSLDEMKKIVASFSSVGDIEKSHKFSWLSKCDAVTKKSLNMDDFREKFHLAISGNEKKDALVKMFFDNTGYKFTKGNIKAHISLKRMIELEEILGISAVTPYFDNGYTHEVEKHASTIRGLDFYSLHSRYVEICADSKVFAEIMKHEKAIVKSGYALSKLKDKTVDEKYFQEREKCIHDLKESLSSLEAITSQNPLTFKDHPLFSNDFSIVEKNIFSIPDNIGDEYTKPSLKSATELSKALQDNKEEFEKNGVDIIEESTVWDYGYKTAPENLVLYANSLISIMRKETKQQEKVKSVQKKNDFAL